MTQLMLDTSAYVAFKQGNQSALVAIQSATRIIVPLVVLGELWAGFAAGNRQKQNRAELEQFLQSPRASVVPLVRATAERYAVIYAFLRQNGRPIPTNDLWIAASAMEHAATLLTSDRHFSHVPQILVHQL